jgi:hypothetical protein
MPIVRDVEKATNSFSKPIFAAQYTVDASRVDASRICKNRIQEKKETAPTKGLLQEIGLKRPRKK